MTLSTHINFLEPVDPEKVFGVAREIIGIPPDREIDDFTHDDIRGIISRPGGYNSMLIMRVSPDGNGDFPRHEYWCVRFEYDSCTCRKWFVQLNLDTAYGFRPCCACLHYQIINKLARSVQTLQHSQPHYPPPQFEWNDEFTGIWYKNVLPPLWCKNHGGIMPLTEVFA